MGVIGALVFPPHLKPSRIKSTLPGRPSSALRHWDVVEYSEVARPYMPELNPTKRWLTWTVYATPLMTSTTALGLSIRLSMFELRETGDWDIFLRPPERARAETGGADQWVLKRRECSGFARVNKVTSASLGYPLAVFNKNSTLKGPDRMTQTFPTGMGDPACTRWRYRGSLVLTSKGIFSWVALFLTGLIPPSYNRGLLAKPTRDPQFEPTDWFWHANFTTNLVRGLSNKEMKFRNKGAVPFCFLV